MPAPPYAVVSPQRNLHYKQVGGEPQHGNGCTSLKYVLAKNVYLRRNNWYAPAGKICDNR